MKWFKLSDPLKAIEAHWMAADVASRQDKGETLVTTNDGESVAWRTVDDKWPGAFHLVPTGIVAHYPAAKWRGRRVAHLDKCVKAGKVIYK